MVPTRIVIHHSLTKDSGTVSWLAIRKYHVLDLGWSDIGYHAGVELVETGSLSHYEILMGRAWDQAGAHTKGENHRSLGLCVVGDFDLEAPSRPALEAAARIIRLWMKLYRITSDEIYRHSHFSTKSCPGRLFDLEALRRLL